MLIKQIASFFTSLKLTVVLLAFAIVLVFLGTLAQVDEGLYQAQSHYFRQWVVVGLDLYGKRIPLILPGGYLIGTLLLANLLAAHIYRFQLSKKKIGILLAHSGVILLLVGQLVTDMLAHETQMYLTEGTSKNYSESASDYELVFNNDAQTTIVPSKLLVSGGDLKIDNLPFTIHVKDYWKNTEAPSFRAPMMKNAPPLTTNGVAANFDFSSKAESKTMDEKNVPSALLELIGPQGSLGVWVVSDWASDENMLELFTRLYVEQLGLDPQMVAGLSARLTAPQSVVVAGKKYTFALRPKRVRHPFSLTLVKVTHTVYPGTITKSDPQGIPKDFRSLIRLQNLQTGENREVEIYMNSPLRYAGMTFYQYQMSAGQMMDRAGLPPSSVLQVVHNPGWLTPYVGCGLVAAGLVTQFLYHLIGFISKRKTK
jgi:hypothetical protein